MFPRIYARRLRSIYIPNTIGTIENYAFQQQALLRYVDFAYDINLTKIGMGAFMGCTILINIEIPQTVQTIGQTAFEGCSTLNNITLPINLTSMDRFAFNQCFGLNSIIIPSRNGSTYTSSLKQISQGCFQRCSSLKEIIIPNNITRIQNAAFNSISSLERIHIYFGSGNIEIDNPFDNCTNLNRIILDKKSSENSNCTITLKDKLFTDKGTTYSNDRVLEFARIHRLRLLA